MLLGLVGDEQQTARPGHANHLANSFGAVVEEVDAAHVKDHVEAGICKGQALGIAQIEIGIPLPAAQVDLAVGQHLRRQIEAGELDAARQIFVLEAGAHRSFEHGITGFGFQQAHIAAEVCVPVETLECAEDSLRVGVKPADCFIQMVVLAVVAGEVFRFEMLTNSKKRQAVWPAAW